MSQVITTALKEMKARQKELQPLAAEFRQVESAIQALEQTRGRTQPTRGSTRKGGARRGRPRKGEPTRSDQFLALVREQPGITIGEAAKHLSVQANYLYRVAAGLERNGAVVRDDGGFSPSRASSA
jgi:hypothetical protein